MNDIHGEVGIDVERLRAADPDGLYLFMLEDYPYMMTSAQVAEFTCATSQGCRVGKKWLVPKLALLNYLYKDEGREGLQSA